MTPFGEFLRTGILGAVRAGASQDDLRAALGEPDDVGNPRTIRKPLDMWTYGGHFLQVFFHSRRVTGFGLDFWHPPRLPDALGIDAIPFTESSAMADVRAWLSERGVAHHVAGEPPDRIVIAGATEIIFDDDGSLQKIMAPAPPREAPGRTGGR
jgi:hypothetical protein